MVDAFESRAAEEDADKLELGELAGRLRALDLDVADEWMLDTLETGARLKECSDPLMVVLLYN